MPSSDLIEFHAYALALAFLIQAIAKDKDEGETEKVSYPRTLSGVLGSVHREHDEAGHMEHGGQAAEGRPSIPHRQAFEDGGILWGQNRSVRS